MIGMSTSRGSTTTGTTKKKYRHDADIVGSRLERTGSLLLVPWNGKRRKGLTIEKSVYVARVHIESEGGTVRVRVGTVQ